jgi:preprotein translocase subunit YajC
MILNGLNLLLAADPGTALEPNQTGQQIKMIGMLLFFAVMMWVMVFAPQRKKTKELDLLLKALRPGDKIVTASGIIGVVLSIRDKSVSIRSADTKLEILKSAVAEVTERSTEASETKS